MNILFLIWNRPELTSQVFESIRRAKPAKLFVAADGPRENSESDRRLCEETRKIISSVDWPCEVVTRFQEKNIGCKYHVSGAITWFFEQAEEGIIIEDDCQPDPTFFAFCDSMLKKYRDDARIMHISGANFQSGKSFGSGSYYFSHCPHIWGWASWRRAWEKYDVEMSDLPFFVEAQKDASLFEDKKVSVFWISLFNHLKKKKIDTWDGQWAYAIMKNEGLCITPNANLVQNIGLGNGTHTAKASDVLQQRAVSMKEIIHPLQIKAEKEADTRLAYRLYIRPWYRRILDKLPL